MAGTGNHDAPDARLKLAQFTHDGADIFSGSEKEHLIAWLDDRFAVRAHTTATPIHGGNARLDARNVFGQIRKGLAHQETTFHSPNADEPHAAISEIDHLECARMFDQALNIFRDQLFRADPSVDRETREFAKQLRMGRV